MTGEAHWLPVLIVFTGLRVLGVQDIGQVQIVAVGHVLVPMDFFIAKGEL